MEANSALQRCLMKASSMSALTDRTPVRLFGISTDAHFPFGAADLFYQLMLEDGRLSEKKRVLRVVMSADGCRELARHLEALAVEIDALEAMPH